MQYAAKNSQEIQLCRNMFFEMFYKFKKSDNYVAETFVISLRHGSLMHFIYV